MTMERVPDVTKELCWARRTAVPKKERMKLWPIPAQPTRQRNNRYAPAPAPAPELLKVGARSAPAAAPQGTR